MDLTHHPRPCSSGCSGGNPTEFSDVRRRGPASATEIDRCDEVLEEEAAGEMPTPAQQRQVLGAHVNLGRPPSGDFCRALRNGRCVMFVVVRVKHDQCHVPDQLPRIPKCYRFDQVCGIDTVDVGNPLDRNKSHELWRRGRSPTEIVTTPQVQCLDKLVEMPIPAQRPVPIFPTMQEPWIWDHDGSWHRATCL